MQSAEGQNTGSEDGEESEEAYAEEKTVDNLLGDEPWVSVIGTVINRDPAESSFILDDGTGQIGVKYSTMPELGSLVRIVAKAFRAADKHMLDAAFVQDFSSFDAELYRRILDLEERVFRRDEDFPR